MARGGYGSGSGVPLRDRVRATTERAGQRAPTPAPEREAPSSAGAAGPPQPPQPPPSAPPAAAGRTEADADCPARHCWVTAPVDATQARPGLLWEWRRVENGRFEGLVSYPARLRPGRWATVTEWVPAELLSQL